MITDRFKFKYWPYMNGQRGVPDCIKQTFSDSLNNLLTRGTALTLPFTAALGALAFF